MNSAGGTNADRNGSHTLPTYAYTPWSSHRPPTVSTTSGDPRLQEWMNCIASGRFAIGTCSGRMRVLLQSSKKSTLPDEFTRSTSGLMPPMAMLIHAAPVACGPSMSVTSSPACLNSATASPIP